MQNNSSFQSLFQQSRYGRGSEVVGDDPKTDRRELFAVAAVAFAIKHSPRFAAHFLRRVCLIADAADANELEFDLQPFHHTDLAVKDPKRRRLFVCEFKFHSSLKPKQDPECEAEFSNSPKGYGRLIANEPRYASFTEKHYIVIQKLSAFDPIIVSGLQCRSVGWKEFNMQKGSLETFVDDMLDSLGEMGIPSLRSRNLNPMKRSDHTTDAVDIHQVCELLIGSLGIKRRQLQWDIGRDSKASWYGVELPLGLSGFKTLDESCKGQDGTLGWFGYQTPVDGKPKLAVWFYAASERAAVATYAAVKVLLKKQKGLRFVEPVDSSFSIEADGDSVLDDRQWFEEVFTALKK